MKANQKRDKTLGQVYRELFNHYLQEIQAELLAYYQGYANRKHIDVDEAKKILTDYDVQAFASKAKRYVQTRDFSQQANVELKLYNYALRASREELLQETIRLAMQDLGQREVDMTGKRLNLAGLRAYEKAAGIMAMTVPTPETMARTIEVLSAKPFNGVKWSDRVWKRQAALSQAVSQAVSDVVVRGRSPLESVGRLQKLFNVSAYEARRLAVTESARMQTEVQKSVYNYNGTKKYCFLAEPTACDICKALDEKVFLVAEMQPGENACPMHPHCHCSSAPEPDREGLEQMFKELDEMESKLGADDGIIALQQRYDYVMNGEKLFIPTGAGITIYGRTSQVY